MTRPAPSDLAQFADPMAVAVSVGRLLNLPGLFYGPPRLIDGRRILVGTGREQRRLWTSSIAASMLGTVHALLGTATSRLHSASTNPITLRTGWGD